MIFVKADWQNDGRRIILWRTFIDPIGKSVPALVYARCGLVPIKVIYVENFISGAVEKNELTFRELAEFKIARARGDFKEIGIA
jgi:hypothetical protein